MYVDVFVADVEVVDVVVDVELVVFFVVIVCMLLWFFVVVFVVVDVGLSRHFNIRDNNSSPAIRYLNKRYNTVQ